MDTREIISKTINLFARVFTSKNLLISVFVSQILFFALFAFLTKGNWLRGDNYLYETPAWNWAAGNGLSINRNEWEDPYLTDLYYTAHPEKAGNDFIPATTFPTGYAYFLGAVYTFTGRSHLAAILVNLILLGITVWLMYSMARRTFGEKPEFYISMSLIAIFPLWAFWATVIMSDTLHLMLITLFAFIFFVDQPSLRRVLISGAVLGLATVIRPYVILLPAALLIGGWIFHCTTFKIKNVLIILILCGAFLGGSVLRNYYEFGKPIITSKGLGDGLWLSTQKDIFADDLTLEEASRRFLEIGVTRPHRNAESRILFDDAVRRIKERPFRDALVTLTSIPRLWISLGSAQTPGAVKIILIVGFGLLFVLMIIGGFMVRKSQNPMLIGAIVIASYYTLVFAHLNTEGRYVLPARFFSFLLVSVASVYFLRLYVPRLFVSHTDR